MTYIPEELRRLVISRAKNCCEYCLMPQEGRLFTYEVDHIVATKHRGKTDEANLCLSCLYCNRHKGSDFASFDADTNQVALLFNPRHDRWSEHFQFNGGIIEPLTATGRVTVYLLNMNDQQRVDERTVLIAAKRYPPAELPVWKKE